MLCPGNIVYRLGMWWWWWGPSSLRLSKRNPKTTTTITINALPSTDAIPNGMRERKKKLQKKRSKEGEGRWRMADGGWHIKTENRTHRNNHLRVSVVVLK